MLGRSSLRPTSASVLVALALSLVITVLPVSGANAFCFGEDEQSSGSDPVSPSCRPEEPQTAIEGFAAAQINASRPSDPLAGWTDLLMSARWWAEQVGMSGASGHDPDLVDHVGHHAGVADLVGTEAITSRQEADVVAAVRTILASWWADTGDRATWTKAAWDHLGVGVVITDEAVTVVAQFRNAAGTPPATWRTHPIDGGHAPSGSDDISPFSDVADDHVFVRAIERMRQRDVTRGCNPEGTLYCPDAGVTRGQMAAFLRRALALPAGTATFQDVPAGHTFRADIAALADADVTRGCNDARTLFCPGNGVTRGQMAAFLVRALGLPAGSATFEDVPPEHTFHGDIAALADAGITLGCNQAGTLFCPDVPVTRGQMAAFLARSGVLDVGWGY